MTSTPDGLVLPVTELMGKVGRLRPWVVGDAPALAAAWCDPLIVERLPIPAHHDEAAAERWIAQRERAWRDGCSVDFAVTDIDTGSVVGEVGLSNFDAGRRAALIGWWVGAGWRGQGRAQEAVRLVVDWVLGDGLLSAVMAVIDGDNEASITVAREAGMRQAQMERADGRLVFARTI